MKQRRLVFGNLFGFDINYFVGALCKRLGSLLNLLTALLDPSTFVFNLAFLAYKSLLSLVLLLALNLLQLHINFIFELFEVLNSQDVDYVPFVFFLPFGGPRHENGSLYPLPFVLIKDLEPV